MDEATLLPPTQDVFEHVQVLSINGTAPPPRYIRRDTDTEHPGPGPATPSMPIIDLHLLSSPSSSFEEKQTELEKLNSALSSWGFFQAVGHGIPSSLLDEVQRMQNEFFDLPMDEKRKYAINFDGTEDYLEGYGNDLVVSKDQIVEWSDRLYLLVKPLDQRNYKLWPERPTGFREVLNEYIANTNLVAEIILKNMAKSLGLEENHFINSVEKDAPTFARFNCYPPCSRPDLVYGIKPHADGGAVTILLQDKEVEGLQVLKDGCWIKVPVVPHALLVNVADMIEIMSNGMFKSAMHRVITNSEKQRISLAVFYIPEKEKCIEPATELIGPSRPRLFKELTVKEYAEIYFQNTSRGMRALDCARI